MVENNFRKYDGHKHKSANRPRVQRQAVKLDTPVPVLPDSKHMLPEPNVKQLQRDIRQLDVSISKAEGKVVL